MQTNDEKEAAPTRPLGEGLPSGAGQDGVEVEEPLKYSTNGAGPNPELSEEHRTILSTRAISDEVRDARGYESVDSKTARKLGFPGNAESLRGLRIPICDVHGAKHSGQLKPDNPALKENGEPRKYVFPPASKQRAMVDVHPWHYPKLGNPKIPLLVTESILKADSATSGWGDDLCVIGESGVYGHRGRNAHGGKTVLGCYESVAIEGRTIYLVPDSDVATNPSVYHATQRKKAFFESRGGIVHIVKLPDKPNGEKQGLDDWRAANPSASLADLLRLVADDLKAPDGLKPYAAIKAEIDANFAVIESYSQIYNLKTERLVPARTFKEVDAAPYRFVRGDGEPANGADAWLKDRERRTHRDIGFRPGEPKVTATNVLNTWIGPGIIAVEGDCSGYFELLDHVFGEAKLSDYFLKLQAWPLAHPEDPKVFVATIMWSNTHGAGKDLIAECLAPQYGIHARHITNRDLRDKFDGYLANALFIHAEEVCSPDRREDAQKLKNLITMPRIQVNEKFKPKVDHPNFANYYITSNYCDAVLVDQKERRYFVHHANEKKFDAEKGRRLIRWAQSEEGESALRFYLLNKVDLSNFNPKNDALETDALREIQDAGLPDLDRYARDVIERGVEKFAKSDIWRLEELSEPVPENEGRDRGLLKRLGKCLSNAGAANLGPIRVDGEQKRLWAIRDGAAWKKRGEAMIAAAFKDRLKHTKRPKFDKDYPAKGLTPFEQHMADDAMAAVSDENAAG